MKRFIACIVILLFSFFLPADVRAEEIFSFHSDIKIEDNGTIVVTEGITYNFGSQERHGIFRNIPYIKTNTEGKRFELLIEDFKVTDGRLNPREYDLTREDGYIKLKIGDPIRLR